MGYINSIMPSTVGFLVPGIFAPFIMVVDTTNAGSASDTFIFPLGAGTYNAVVDWGDGNVETFGEVKKSVLFEELDVEHNYATGGTYVISFTATDKDGDALKPVSLQVLVSDETPPATPPAPPVDVLTAQELSIPEWVKDTAGWWSDRAVEDTDFTGGISYLIEEDIIHIPDLPAATEAVEENVPEWVRDLAGWWSEDLTTDQEFADAIKYLVEQGIIQVKT